MSPPSESSAEIDRLSDELIVLRAENLLLRQAVEQFKARLAYSDVQAHRSEMPSDAATASELKGKKAIYWG